MNFLELRCRLEKCVIDNTKEMEIKKCTTQNDKANPDKFQPCPNLSITSGYGYKRGDVWQKFGDMIEKSKPKGKDKLI